MAERALLRRLEGGCQVPVGALATLAGDQLRISAVVCSLDGARSVERFCEGRSSSADEVGLALAENLLQAGAAEILDNIRVGGDRL
jgi:hydroxymethylbilane synthase